jgi:glycosyltransferase involved in cell wall biosynthesis
MPGLEPLADAELAAKLADAGPTRVLFVGKQAQRKGLPELIRAFAALTPETRAKLEVTVVSAFVDGPVALPAGWRHARFVDDLYAAMGAAHVLAFPTLREAYGLVLVEGMARGLAVLTTSAPLQRDIVGADGGAFAAPTDTAAMARALTELARDRARVAAMARANVARFRREYCHEVGGPAHLRAFDGARRG